MITYLKLRCNLFPASDPHLFIRKLRPLMLGLLPFHNRIASFRIAVGLILILGTIQLRANVDIPERPADYVLDQGKMFPPEIAQRLIGSLKSCAKEHDVHIYVMTVPTLQVMPSRVKEKLEELGTAVTESWTQGQIGAVIVFDNEAGWVTVGASEEAERVFSAIAINMVFRDPLINTRKKHLSPEKLEAAAMVLVKGMTDLKVKADREEKSHQTVRMIILLIIIGALCIAILGVIGKTRETKDISSNIE